MFNPKILLAICILLSSMPIFAQSKSAALTPIKCDGKYALCTSAQCIPDPRNHNMAICSCTVQNGSNAGFSSCQKRVLIHDINNVTYLLSTFSFEELPNKKKMYCQHGGDWSNCLDQPCTIDPLNPNHAICSCPLESTPKYITFGGVCDTNTCKTGFWSAAEPEAANHLEAFFAQSFTQEDKQQYLLKACSINPTQSPM